MSGYIVMLMKDSEGLRQTPTFVSDARPESEYPNGLFPTYPLANKHREYMKSIYPNNWYAIAHVNNVAKEE